MSFNLKGVELECAKRLAALFQEGKFTWTYQQNPEQLGLSAENYSVVLATLEAAGAIKEPMHSTLTDFHHFQITATAVQIARQQEEQAEKAKEGKDIVESVKVTLKKHPVAGWAIVVVSAILFIAASITQVHGALKALGIVKD